MTEIPNDNSTENDYREQLKVSCLMVTANRKHLAKRAVDCYLNQTYRNKELVIIDDGDQDYSSVLANVPEQELRYIRLQKEPDFVLGKLRNKSLDMATGDYLIQWDDDDWYHSDRIAMQAAILDKGYDACCLSSSLMHLDTPEFLEHPYIGILPGGIPGSIMHVKNESIRYPETRRAEDTVYLDEWMKLKYYKIDDSYNYLFLRAFHGDNTWEKEHFIRRIRNSPSSLLQYLWHAKIRGSLFDHPRFQLSQKAQLAFNEYLNVSRELNLI